MPIWHDTRSTDEAHNQKLCPLGETSWCGYQRDLAKATSEYTHKHSLSKGVCDDILPILKDLSKAQLLSACLHGTTQNQCEAFNALIWQCASKQMHSSLQLLSWQDTWLLVVLMMVPRLL